MNNWIAGAAGAAAAVLITASALVLANRPASDEPEVKDEKHVVATRTVCNDEKVVTKKEWGVNSVVGTVLGGAAGGALGHQFGGGKGKDVATTVGALGGAYAGHEVANNKFPDSKVSYRQRCHEVPVEG